MRFAGVFLLIIGLLTSRMCATHAAESSAEAVEFFEKKIRPILVTHCSESPKQKLTDTQIADLKAWSALARVLMSSNEFVFVD